VGDYVCKLNVILPVGLYCSLVLTREFVSALLQTDDRNASEITE
jgi:hypothetical protein